VVSSGREDLGKGVANSRVLQHRQKIALCVVVWMGSIVTCPAFTAIDTNKTIRTDGTYSDTTNGIAYVKAKAQDGWVMTVGTAGGSYTWIHQCDVNIANTFTIQGASPNNRPLITFGAGSYPGNGAGISVNATSNHIVTVKDFVLTDAAGGPAGAILWIKGQGVCFRVSNVMFTNKVAANNCGYVGNINGDNHPGPYGVWDHCQFISTGLSVYGVFVMHNGSQNHYAWTIPMSWGTTNAVYFEDCWDYASAGNGRAGAPMVDGDGGARVVIRQCNLTNNDITFHGIASGASDGTQQVEFYQNYFYTDETLNGFPWVMWLRGGTGLIFSNTVRQSTAGLLGTCWRFSVECASSQWQAEHCLTLQQYPADYPASQQIGRGVAGASEGSVPVYIWSNTVPATTFGPTQLGMDTDAPFIQQGRDIFTNSVKSGYAPLVYPHPLVTSSQFTPPSPPSGLKIVSTGP
jgi:hypothetical protein